MFFFFGSLVRNETVDFDGQEKRLNKRSEELLAFGFWQLPQKLRGRIFLTIKQIRRNQTHPMQRKAASPAVSRNRERIIWWWRGAETVDESKKKSPSVESEIRKLCVLARCIKNLWKRRHFFRWPAQSSQN